MSSIKQKAKVCKCCSKEFITMNSLVKACSVKCAITLGKKETQVKIERERKRELKEKRERLKTKSEHAKEAQVAFNAFIRERDYNQPCISCGRHHSGQYHAGHYRSVGACPELRFNELNVHKQCSACNNHKSGNIVEYRINLIKKIGAENVELLESTHEIQHYTIEQLKEIKATYKAKVRELKKIREMA